MQRNLFAYTAPAGSFPEYISVNAKPNKDVTIVVRSAPDLGGSCAEITLSREQLKALNVALAAELQG